jgi:hypothetical protein
MGILVSSAGAPKANEDVYGRLNGARCPMLQSVLRGLNLVSHAIRRILQLCKLTFKIFVARPRSRSEMVCRYSTIAFFLQGGVVIAKEGGDRA